MKTIVGLTKNEVKQTGKAIDAYYNSLAKQNGMTMAEFRKGTSSMAEFDKMQEGYRNYLKWRQENTFNDMYGNRIVREGNPYQEFKKWGTFRVDKMGENSYNELIGLIRQQQQQQSQMYSTMGQAYRSINRAEGITVKGLMNGGTSGGGGGKGGGKTGTEIDYAPDSIKAQQAEVQRLTKLWQGAGESVRDDYKKQLEEAQYTLDKMTGKEKFDPTKMGQIQGMSLVPKIEVPKIEMPDISGLKQQIQLELTAQNVKVDEATLKTLLQDAFQNGIDMMDVQFAMINQKIANGVDVPDSAWQSILDQYNEIRTMIGQEPIQIDFNTGGIVKTGKDTEKSWQAAAQAVQSVGSALQQIDDPGAKIMGIIGEAIANIASGFAQASAHEGKGGVWYWIAATAAGLGTMISTISAIHNATGYATGGIVEGNTYSGDQIPIMANAGEVVLNRAQSGVLAAQLEGGVSGSGGGTVRTVLSGEQCYLMIDRYARRTGKGEMMFWR